MIFQDPALPQPLTRISPWLDMQTNDLGEIVQLLDEQTHRRFIKTHTPLDGLPRDTRVTYLCVGRDPRDVALSMDNHVANLDFEALLRAREAAVGLDDLQELTTHAAGQARSDDVRERVLQWIDNPSSPTDELSSLRSTLHHLDTFWQERSDANIALFHYGDLQADLPGEMRQLAEVLGVEVPDARWDLLVDAARFDRMKERATDLAPDVDNGIWQDTREFFHRGTNGQWRDVLDEHDVQRYRERVRVLADPDLASWAHVGWRGAAEW